MSFFNKNVMEKTQITNKVYHFVVKNWLIILILLIGAFLRLYKINEYMTFLGDEGRDSIIVRNLLVHADPILIGPGTSVGSMYLGPLYYYFMASFLFLFNFSPVGPAIGVALLGVATIYLIYITGREWFSNIAGLVAAALFAISPTVIIFSRSSWNPNIMPFFAMLSVYSIWRVYKNKEYKWLVVTAISFAFVLQSHYLGVLIAPVLFIYWILARVPKNYSLFSIFLFLFLMSPLLIFDIRHDFLNSKALYKFLTVRQETVSIKPWTAIPKTYPIFEQINSSLLTAKNAKVGSLVTILFTVYLVFIFTRRKKLIQDQHYLILLWLISGLIGFGIYKQNVYDHYFGFLFPIPFLLLGSLVEDRMKQKSKLLNIVILSILISLVVLNLKNNPLFKTPNNQMQRSIEVAKKIIDESKYERFNIAVIAEQNYEDGYQYFLEKENTKVIEIDPQIPASVTDQLFVICEVNGSSLTKETCNPTNSPKAQVANFGWSKIENQWEVDGVIIYKLIHNYPENK